MQYVSSAVWIALFLALMIGAMKRPAWGVALYFQTYFVNPNYWWWGKSSLLGMFDRWSLLGGIILLISVLLNRARNTRPDPEGAERVKRLMMYILMNATLVHFIIAGYSPISAGPYFQLAKFVLLFFLILEAIRSPKDLQIIILAIVLGAGYIGYEVTWNKRGKQEKGRMEGIGAPNARGANQLASLMVTVLPMIGALALVGRNWPQKILAMWMAIFVLNVVILCDSRGAFLSMILAAITLLVTSKGKTRKKAIIGLILGGITTYLLLGDPRVMERFYTTFAGSEERDASAANRLIYWGAGLRSVMDHPLGSGGNGFKKLHYKEYLNRPGVTSVHSGIINEACEWGIQGLLLRLFFVAQASLCAYRVWKFRSKIPDSETSFFSVSLITCMAGFMLTCAFGDFLDAEWGYWIPAILVGWAKIYGPPATAETAGGIGKESSGP